MVSKAETKVRKRYPRAYEYGGADEWRNGVPYGDHWDILFDEPDGVITLGHGRTKAAAWEDAAKRLETQ